MQICFSKNILFIILIFGNIYTFKAQNKKEPKHGLFYKNWQKHRIQDSIFHANSSQHQAVVSTRINKGYFSKNTVYLYYDAFRQTGAGYRHSFSPYVDLNMEAGYIGTNAGMGYTGFNDFFIKKGFSLNILPKFVLFSVRGLYMGPLITFQHMSYKNKWVEQISGYSKYFAPYSARADLSSNGFTFQFCLGIKQNYKWLAFETFMSLGTEQNYEHKTWYEVNREFRFKNISYPYSFK